MIERRVKRGLVMEENGWIGFLSVSVFFEIIGAKSVEEGIQKDDLTHEVFGL